MSTTQKTNILPTFISEACNLMSVKMAPQATYAGTQAIFPSGPERIKTNVKKKCDKPTKQ
jgi:hypothetical protein